MHDGAGYLLTDCVSQGKKPHANGSIPLAFIGNMDSIISGLLTPGANVNEASLDWVSGNPLREGGSKSRGGD